MTLSELQSDWPDGARLQWRAKGATEWKDAPMGTPPLRWIWFRSWYDPHDPETWGPVTLAWRIVDSAGGVLAAGVRKVDWPGTTRPPRCQCIVCACASPGIHTSEVSAQVCLRCLYH
jgi:hypothetical protein